MFVTKLVPLKRSVALALQRAVRLERDCGLFDWVLKPALTQLSQNATQLPREFAAYSRCLSGVTFTVDERLKIHYLVS